MYAIRSYYVLFGTRPGTPPLFLQLQLHWVDMRTRHGNQTFAADIGVADLAVFIDILQQHLIAFKPVERLLEQRFIHAFPHALLTTAVVFIEAGGFLPLSVRFNLKSSNQAADTTGASSYNFV